MRIMPLYAWEFLIIFRHIIAEGSLSKQLFCKWSIAQPVYIIIIYSQSRTNTNPQTKLIWYKMCFSYTTKSWLQNERFDCMMSWNLIVMITSAETSSIEWKVTTIDSRWVNMHACNPFNPFMSPNSDKIIIQECSSRL